MASYELSEVTGESIAMETDGFILLEMSFGPEAWVPITKNTGLWTPEVRVTILDTT